jgi:hypothetical protein
MYPLLICRLSAILAVGATFLLPAFSVNAAIAPQYERMRQFGFAMSRGSEAAAKLNRHGLVDRIEAVGGMVFRFWAKQCFVPVTLTTEPDRPSTDNRPPMVGAPTHYQASIGEVHCN